MTLKAGDFKAAVFVVLAVCATASPGDFGEIRESQLDENAMMLCATHTLETPSTEDDYVPRGKATSMQRFKLTAGLKAEFVARNVCYKAAMLAFRPR